MAPQQKRYFVRVVLSGTVEIAEHGYTFGPFAKLATAEECVIALAGRSDVRSATLEEVNDR